MVSFTCNYCQDVVKKPKVPSHANTCRASSFTCVDCMEVFDLQTIKGHTSCITETEKYQGKWRQKIVTTQKRHDSDADDNDNGKTIHQSLRSRRPQMNFSSDSDTDDDAWVTKKRNKAAAATIEISNGIKTPEKSPNGSPQRRARAATSSLHYGSETNGVTKRQRQEPLQLPRAVTAADCIVPSFVLGTDEEVADVARCVLEEVDQGALSVRGLAKKMVERYNARIAKQVRHAIETAIRNGKLREQDGVVTAP